MLTRRRLVTKASMLIGSTSVFSAYSLSRYSTEAFNIDDFELHRVPIDSLPYSRKHLRAVGTGANPDDQGVVRLHLNGEYFDHPVMQAQFAMRMITSYSVSGEYQYLEAARANATRLLEAATEEFGALYFPYPFTSHVHGIQDLALDPPWYSGMAQGQVLSVFLRMATIDESQDWIEAAVKTFASYLAIDDANRPWSPNTDAEGYLWFEEYPVPGQNQEVFNGTVFSLFGLYEYWLTTDDERAIPLIKGMLTTAKHRVLELRVEGQPSRYGMIHDVQADRYHQVHIAQLLELYAWTNDPAFAKIADVFADDYPPYTIQNVMTIPSGEHEIGWLKSDKPHLSFESIETRTFESDLDVRVVERRKELDSNTYWYRVLGIDPPLFWIKETDQFHIDFADGGRIDTGRLDPLSLPYYWERSVVFAPATYRVFDQDDQAEESMTLDATRSGVCDARAIISRSWFLHVSFDDGESWQWLEQLSSTELG